MLSITPHLIRNVQRPEASASEFSAGTEASFRRRPDLTVRTPVQLPAPPGALPAPAAPANPANPANAAAPAEAQGATTQAILPPPVQAMPLSTGQPAPLPATQGVQPQPVQPAVEISPSPQQ